MADIQISFDDGATSAQRIAAIFSVEGEELKERMGQLAAAALEEYELALGERFPSTIKEQRELRLRLLYKHLPGELPTDEQIAQLFQMTRAQVGTLIAGTRARFGPELERRLRDAAKAALKGATESDSDTARIVAAESLRRYMSDLVSETEAPPLEKVRTASRTYDVPRDTIRALCRKLGQSPTLVKALKWEDEE